MKKKILVVDDEKEIADLVELYLLKEGYYVYKAYSGLKAIELVNDKDIDLAILDLMLPDVNGFQICKAIRDKYNYPIIMLTAKDDEFDKVNGLMIGADDYMVKPFLPLELIARVKAQLRRYFVLSGDMQTDNLISIRGLEMDLVTRKCTLNEDPIEFTPIEFEILKSLIKNIGNVVSAEELFHMIWEDEYYTKNNNTVAVHIRHIREKMKDSAEYPKYIKTVWGVGYKIEE
ncbi:MAG: response regulator transcription factor [Tissierellia bacterium]|nr:response regulator transcription factor [Tissierellia bacterium]